MAELVLELLSEEIPARMQAPMAQQFKDAMGEALRAQDVFFQHSEAYVTPRRLVLLMDGLSITQESKMVERRGPRIDAPQEAIDGFARSTGIPIEQLTKRDTPKGTFYFAIAEQKGQPVKEVLATTLQDVIHRLTWPKSMRWGAHSVRWVRPLKNICCIFGGEVLPITYGPLSANDNSTGHRFLAPQPFVVDSFRQYKNALAERYVLLDTEERKTRITEQAQALADKAKLTVVRDDALLEEVAGLVEWPRVLLGDIDTAFMHLPEEVLITAIRTHQKYFCLRDKTGQLAPHFLVVANMETADNEKAILTGNARVLRARLADAAFFWEQDHKKTLESRMPQLEKVVFHARLGTVAEKAERLRQLALFLDVWIPHANLTLTERAAVLAKADLVTEMVGEFPELQGIMGYYYAQAQGEPEEIALAIKEHYLPAGAQDPVPQNPISIAIAIADKIDTLVGLFAIGEAPTGSKDPFALRRAAIGIIRIILEHQLSLPLRLLIEHALKDYPSKVLKPPVDKDKGGRISRSVKRLRAKPAKPDELVDMLLAFFIDRLKALLKGRGIRHDLIHAVFAGGDEDDLLRLMQRVAALDRFLTTEDGINLLAAYKRAANIVQIEEKRDGKTYDSAPVKLLMQQEEEKALHKQITAIRPKIKKALKDNRFEEAMRFLAQLRTPIDAFFDNVTVNTEDRDLRQNRLLLLAQLRESLHEIADFSVIEG